MHPGQVQVPWVGTRRLQTNLHLPQLSCIGALRCTSPRRLHSAYGQHVEEPTQRSKEVGGDGEEAKWGILGKRESRRRMLPAVGRQGTGSGAGTQQIC